MGMLWYKFITISLIVVFTTRPPKHYSTITRIRVASSQLTKRSSIEPRSISCKNRENMILALHSRLCFDLICEDYDFPCKFWNSFGISRPCLTAGRADGLHPAIGQVKYSNESLCLWTMVGHPSQTRKVAWYCHAQLLEKKPGPAFLPHVFAVTHMFTHISLYIYIYIYLYE